VLEKDTHQSGPDGDLQLNRSPDEAYCDPYASTAALCRLHYYVRDNMTPSDVENTRLTSYSEDHSFVPGAGRNGGVIIGGCKTSWAGGAGAGMGTGTVVAEPASPRRPVT